MYGVLRVFYVVIRGDRDTATHTSCCARHSGGPKARSPPGAAHPRLGAVGKAERAAEAKSKAKGMRADAPEFVPVPQPCGLSPALSQLAFLSSARKFSEITKSFNMFCLTMLVHSATPPEQVSGESAALISEESYDGATPQGAHARDLRFARSRMRLGSGRLLRASHCSGF